MHSAQTQNNNDFLSTVTFNAVRGLDKLLFINKTTTGKYFGVYYKGFIKNSNDFCEEDDLFIFSLNSKQKFDLSKNNKASPIVCFEGKKKRVYQVGNYNNGDILINNLGKNMSFCKNLKNGFDGIEDEDVIAGCHYPQTFCVEQLWIYQLE